MTGIAKKCKWQKMQKYCNMPLCRYTINTCFIPAPATCAGGAPLIVASSGRCADAASGAAPVTGDCEAVAGALGRSFGRTVSQRRFPYGCLFPPRTPAGQALYNSLTESDRECGHRGMYCICTCAPQPATAPHPAPRPLGWRSTGASAD